MCRFMHAWIVQLVGGWGPAYIPDHTLIVTDTLDIANNYVHDCFKRGVSTPNVCDASEIGSINTSSFWPEICV